VCEGGDTCILASWLGDSGCRLILRTLRLVHRSRYKTFRRFVSIFLILLLFKANNEFRNLLKRADFVTFSSIQICRKGIFVFISWVLVIKQAQIYCYIMFHKLGSNWSSNVYQLMEVNSVTDKSEKREMKSIFCDNYLISDLPSTNFPNFRATFVPFSNDRFFCWNGLFAGGNLTTWLWREHNDQKPKKKIEQTHKHAIDNDHGASREYQVP